MLEVFDGSHAACQRTPDDHDDWKIDGWFQADEEHVRWRLKEDVSDEEHHERNAVFIGCEFEVLGHASNFSVSDAAVLLVDDIKMIGY